MVCMHLLMANLGHYIGEVMKEWSGKITEHSKKDWNGIDLFSFKIEGADRWFRTGRDQIPQVVGETIAFTERNNQVIVETVATSVPETSGVCEEAGATTSKSKDSVPAPAMDVGKRIQWQQARRDATNVVVAALHTEALPWASNVAKSKKLDLLRGYIKELTEQLLEDEANE